MFVKDNLPVIIFDDFTTAIKYVDFPFKVKSSAMKILSAYDRQRIDIKFVFLVMKSIDFEASRHKRYWIAEYSKLKIPVPPISIQKELIAKIDKEEEIISANQHLITLMESKIEQVFSNIWHK